MTRISMHLPPDVADWVAKKALEEKRSLSQAASVIVQAAYENEIWDAQGNYVDHIHGVTPQPTPIMEAVQKIRSRRPSKPTFAPPKMPEDAEGRN